MQRARRIVKRLRLVLAMVVGLLALYAALSYRVFTVPGEYDAKRAEKFPVCGIEPGDSLLLQNLNLWREPRLGDVVVYRPKGDDDWIGRIAGMPGERLERTGATMRVGGRAPLDVGFGIGPEMKVRDGDVIPDGCYLILADRDEADYEDSRAFGYVPREVIRNRVALNFADLFGRDAATNRTAPQG